MDLGPLLRAHSYLRVERPVTLWPAAADDVTLIPLLGLMIVAALTRGTELADVGLLESNVTIDHDDGPLPAGDFVALTVSGIGDWSPEVSWLPDDPTAVLLVNPELTDAVRVAAASWAYTRAVDGHGSITVLFPKRAS